MSSSGRAELGRRLVERAYLEGDFVLRSGRRSRYYLDKYRFETDPGAPGRPRRASWPRSCARTRRRPSSWPGPSWARCRSPR